MVGWYNLICWTPLSSKISLYSPPYPHTPTLKTRLTLSLYTLWGESLSVEAESECKPLLWCNRTLQQAVWSCFGPEKPLFFTWTTTSAERVRQQALFVESSVCLPLFFLPFFVFHPQFVSLCQTKSLIQIKFEFEANYHKEERALIHILYLDTNVCFRHLLLLSIYAPFSLLSLNRICLCLSLCTDTGIIFLDCTTGIAIAKENVTGKCLDDKSFSKLFCSSTILPAIHPSSCCVPIYPTSFHYLHYNIELCRCIVECFGRWLALLCLCYCFGIVFSIYDLFGVQCGQCACKYPCPIMLAVFVRQLSSLRGIDEELAGGWNGAVCFCREICACTHTHTCTHLCPQPISDMRNCTLICIRIIDTSN